MKHSWRIFELVLSGIQICFGLVMLLFVYKTIIEYYNILWKNPLIDHISIIEMALRKNAALAIVSLIAISSGILLIKNLSKGWVMSIITWIMLTITLIINSYRMYQHNPLELDLFSKIILSVMVIIFIIILVLLNNTAFTQKYKPTRGKWIAIAVMIVALVATKFV